MIAILVFAVAFALLWWADAGAIDGRRGPLAWLSWLVPFVLFAGNRYNGADWINYKSGFETLAGIASPVEAIASSPFEWLVSLLMWALGRLGAPYEAFVFTIGTFSVFGLQSIFRGIGISLPGKTFALLMLIEGWTLYHEQLRQSVAVTLCLMALIDTRRNAWLRAIFLWIAATGFHGSAFIAPMLLFLATHIHRKGNRPATVTWTIVSAGGLFLIIAASLAVLRQGLIPGLERIQNKLVLYEEHAVFGGALFTAGLLGYVIGLALLLRVRKAVEARTEFWLSLCWSAALMWSLLGPLLRTEAILIRFEHYLLIFLPLTFGLLLPSPTPAVGPSRAPGMLLVAIFAMTFPLRVFLNPENVVWTLNYQNTLIYGLTNTELDDDDFRQTLICANLALFDNDFCGRDAD